MTPTETKNCKLTGVRVTPLTLGDLVNTVNNSLRCGTSLTIAGHNLHSAYLSQTVPEMKSFYLQADLILADGAPILWDYRFSGGKVRSERLGSTDWIPKVASLSVIKRVMIIGATSNANRLCVEAVKQMNPEAEVLGYPGEAWNFTLQRKAIDEFLRFQPNLTLIGLGMPKQEQFALLLRETSDSAVIATVGGAIDQIAGVQCNAPRWIGPLGVEWLWRLVSQPSRLWHRYLIEPWKLLGIRAKQLFR